MADGGAALDEVASETGGSADAAADADSAAGPDAAADLPPTADDGAAPDDSDAVAADTKPACPTYAPQTVAGVLAAPDLKELSGLVASVSQPGILWTHNDSEKQGRVYAVDTAANLRALVELPATTVTDWEDIALGPAADASQTALYVGDIGDNDAIRKQIIVWRVAEPTVPAGPNVAVLTVAAAEEFKFTYPDGPHDAESLICDPANGDLWIATKVKSGKTRIFRANAPLQTGPATVLQKIVELKFGAGALGKDEAVSGGSILPDGSWVALRTNTTAYAWKRAQGSGIAEAFLGQPCPLPMKGEPQGEGIALTPTGFYSVGEGAQGPLHFSKLN